ncbi:MAG: phytanoyl-CoA dioxygenase family protein [Alphaproteobacteria bacterium]|nr:phytanoyl-CoA dioxygenase family protein [Alphaproteobacteria bacterium]
MPHALTDAQVQSYRDDGFLAPIDVFEAARAGGYRKRLEESEARLGGFTGDLKFKPHLYLTWLDEIVHAPEVLDPVADAIGEDILLVQLTVWIKEPHTDAYISWHRDGTYFGLEPHEHVTAWVALSEASEESGCVMVLPGSHKLGDLTHTVEKQAGNMLTSGQSVDVSGIEAEPVLMALRPGQMSLHHTDLLHSSRPNGSDDRRIGLGISYIPTRVRATSGVRLSATLVRGEDRFGHFDHDARPQTDFGETEMARHAKAMAAWNEGRRVMTERLEGAA